MKRHAQWFAGLALLAVLAAALSTSPLWMAPQRADAATPISGAYTATAGTGGTTSGLLVKFESAGVIITATAVTDSVLGVCEQTADADALTRYAPMGTRATVTSGELIALGNLLTAGTGGKAFVLDTDDASTQRTCGIALSAASAADEDVTVLLMPGTAEQRFTLAGDLVVSGTGALTTGTGAIALNGDVTVASGKDLVLPGGAAYLAFTGATNDLQVLAADQGTATRTLTIPDCGASDKYVVITTASNGKITNAEVNVSASIERSKMDEEELAVCGVPFQALRNDDGTVMDATGGAGLFSLSCGGFGTGTVVVAGEAASGNSKTDTLQFEFIVPPEYVASGDVRLVVTATETVGAATTATTLSGEVYESDGEGAVGADILASWDATDVTMGYATFTGTITDAGLVAGDRLILFVRIVTNDTSGSVGTVANIGKVEVQLDIKG